MRFFHTAAALEKNNIYFQLTWLKVSFLRFQPLKHTSIIFSPAVGAEAHKDKVFVLDLKVAFLLSRLESLQMSKKPFFPIVVFE